MERPPNDRNAADAALRAPVHDLIGNIKMGSQNLNLQVIVLDLLNRYTSKDKHEIRIFKVADRSGSIHMAVYDEIGAVLQPGDICRLTRCYATNHKGLLILYIGKSGKLHKIGEFCMLYSESPNMSETLVQNVNMNKPTISFEGRVGGGPVPNT